MNQITILIIVNIITVFISIFLAIFLITVKTNHKISNVLFALFLIITAIDGSTPLFNLWVKSPSNLGMLRNTLAFLQIPIFYLYVVAVCYSDFRFKIKYIAHFIPFLLVNIILVPRFYAADISSKIYFIENRQTRIELQFTHVFFHIQILIYLIAVFLLLRKVKKLYLENYSGTSIKSYHWLLQFSVILSLLYLLTLVKNIFKFSDYPNISEWIKTGLLLVQLLISCWYLLKALNNPDLFRNISSKLKLVSDIVSEEQRNNTVETNADVNTYEYESERLTNYMATEKPFLNPSLTIQNISDALQIPVRDLSLLINHKLGQHFFDFINAYRIENAKLILQDETKRKVTILEILYEVGFNSKSSFNTAFKKHTGFTPTNYRKSQINNAL